MIELIWRLETASLDRDERVRPIFEQIAEVPQFEPDSYDLNQKRQWRDFDLERTVVDALTQRTQLVRVRGTESGTIAMVAMGKHGEQPTVVVRLAEPVDLEALTEQWPRLVEDLQLEMTLITSEAWRDALEEDGLLWRDESLSPAFVYGWPSGGAPEWLERVETDPELESTPVDVERRENSTVLWLARHADIRNEGHRRALREIGTFAA